MRSRLWQALQSKSSLSQALEWDWGGGMDASGLKGRCPLPLVNRRRSKGYMILVWSIDRYDWYQLTSLEIAERRYNLSRCLMDSPCLADSLCLSPCTKKETKLQKQSRLAASIGFGRRDVKSHKLAICAVRGMCLVNSTISLSILDGYRVVPWGLESLMRYADIDFLRRPTVYCDSQHRG